MRIAAVSPAWPPDTARLETAVARVESWGHEVVAGSHIHAPRRHGAVVDLDSRVADLEWALTVDGVDAVWFTRGGYGTAHVLAWLSEIDLDAIGGRRIIGFSDATALLVALYARGFAGGVHGPALQSMGGRLDAESQDAMRRFLAGDSPRGFDVHLVGAESPAVAANVHPPEASAPEGPVVGGNLSVLASLCGTPWQLDAGGAIVVLEDIGEAPYRVHRLVTQLVQAGILRKAAGVVLGDIHHDGDGRACADAAVDALAGSVPVFAGAPIGHGARNLPFAYGAHAEIAGGRLTFGSA